MQALPNSDISYAASFKDGKNHNLYGIGQADAGGKFVWTFPIPVDAAYGKATVLVAASSVDGGGGSSTSFEVAKTGC